MSKSSVSEWYADQKIFITGATGFMGQVLVEKLLRSCPDVAAIYILLRPKKQKDPATRLANFLESSVFDKLRTEFNAEKIFRKLFVVSGDILQKNCGLSDTDKTLLESTVTLILHMAADVRFNQPLKTAVRSNVGGTLNVLELARGFEKLKAFVHVSTLYCHCDENVVEEKLYSAPHDPRKVLDLVNWLDDASLRLLTPRLLRNYPNCYAYTKCLTEDLVCQYTDVFPVAIVRPSTVSAAYRDPAPGWLDGFNGTTGIIMAMGKGLLQSIWCDTELKVNLVPVDVSINGLLIAAWNGDSEMRKGEIKVYHTMTNEDSLRSWGESFELAKKHYMNYPYSVALWYPGCSLQTSYLLHRLSVLVFQYIPAYILDFLLVLVRRKPFLIDAQRRIRDGLHVFAYYVTRPWNFRNERLLKLYDSLDESDKETYFINRHEFDHDEYIRNYILGIRKYSCKEDISTVPQARKLLRRLSYLRVLANILFYGLLLWILFMFIN